MKINCLLALAAIAIFLFSCDQTTSDSKNEEASTIDKSVYDLAADSVKIVKTGSLNVKVKDVGKSVRDVSALAKSYSGLIQHQAQQSVSSESKEIKISPDSLLQISVFTPTADITARIPSEHLEQFIFDIQDIGYYVNSSSLDIDDRSLSYLENLLKQKNRKQVIKQGSNPVNASGKAKIIEINDEVIEQEIANRSIDADVKYSTVSLNLFQNSVVRKETVANYIIADYNLGFWQRADNAFNDGWAMFSSFLLIIGQLWAFILTGLIVVYGYRLWQRRKLV